MATTPEERVALLNRRSNPYQLLPAVSADAVQEELMPGGAESARELWFERRNATLKLIQLSATVALEMMMMFFARYSYRVESPGISTGCNHP
jgi:hypothetical protein